MLALLVLALTSVVGVGHTAPDPKTAAKKLVVEGAALIKRGDYEGALVRFKAAFDLVPSPKIQYNLGIAFMGLERNAEAYDAFQTFLTDASGATTETITKARLYKESLLLKVCRLTVHSDVQGATVTLDGKPHGTTPPPGEIMVDAGNHSLVVAKDGVGTPFTKWFEVSAGSTLTIDANLLPPAPPPPPALAIRDPATAGPDLTAGANAPPPRRWAKVTGYTVGGLAVAALGFGTFEWVIKELRYGDFNSHHCNLSAPNAGGPGCVQFNSEGSSAKKLGYIGFATAGVLGATSAIFFYVGRNHSRAAAASEEHALVCAPSLTTPGAACQLTF